MEAFGLFSLKFQQFCERLCIWCDSQVFSLSVKGFDDFSQPTFTCSLFNTELCGKSKLDSLKLLILCFFVANYFAGSQTVILMVGGVSRQMPVTFILGYRKA